MAAVALFVPAITLAYLLVGVDVATITSGLFLWAAVSVCVWIGGDLTRLRRERIAGLEEQARRSAREAERERRLAVAEERTRIARELHDSAGHAINVILVQAGAARLLQDRDPEGTRHAIGTIEDVARTTVTEIDRLVHALREEDPAAPPTPADPGALEQLLRERRGDGLAIATNIHGEPRPLPSGVAWAAYRILQEALTNAARHGSGTADVALAFGADAVEIAVTNPTVRNPGVPNPSGRGPAMPNPATSGRSAVGVGGHGIIGMRERATLLGGSFDAGARNGAFLLRARLPIGGAAT
nr:histidine kinase [Actinopolymorpha pittospori]